MLPPADFTEFTNLMNRADHAASLGDLSRAAAVLEAAVLNDLADVDTWLKLAAVRRRMQDDLSALVAVEGALGLSPLNFVALLLRATVLEKLGREDAGECFGRAIAQRPCGYLEPTLQKMLDHATTCYSAWQISLDQKLADAVRNCPTPGPFESARLDRFRTNITRQTRQYFSEPSDYAYPGLPAIEFYDRDLFDWIDRVQAATDQVAAEFGRCILDHRKELIPYVQYEQGQPTRQWAELNHSLDWSALHLLRNGTSVSANVQHCPATMALLESLPQPKVAGVSPNAMFSLLAPGAIIPPHTGVANTRLICHLPIVVPGDCWFRVGAERRSWRRGEVLVFDDTIEHEAVNQSNEMRVVLIFDIWQPALSDVEQAGIAAMVTANETRCRVAN